MEIITAISISPPTDDSTAINITSSLSPLIGSTVVEVLPVGRASEDPELVIVVVVGEAADDLEGGDVELAEDTEDGTGVVVIGSEVVVVGGLVVEVVVAGTVVVVVGGTVVVVVIVEVVVAGTVVVVVGGTVVIVVVVVVGSGVVVRPSK